MQDDSTMDIHTVGIFHSHDHRESENICHYSSVSFLNRVWVFGILWDFAAPIDETSISVYNSIQKRLSSLSWNDDSRGKFQYALERKEEDGLHHIADEGCDKTLVISQLQEYRRPTAEETYNLFRNMAREGHLATYVSGQSFAGFNGFSSKL